MKKVINDNFPKMMSNILKTYVYVIMIYHFYQERMKIEKVDKLVSNLHDKTEYVIHIRNLKLALNHGLVLEMVHRVIKFNQIAWLNPYIDMNTDQRKQAKTGFENIFFS